MMHEKAGCFVFVSADSLDIVETAGSQCSTEAGKTTWTPRRPLARSRGEKMQSYERMSAAE